MQALAGALTYDEILREAVPVPALGATASSPCPVHALLLACLHRVAHHADSPELLWLMDIHLLAGRLSADEWRVLLELARARAIWGVCAHSLACARAAFHTTFPPPVLEALDERPDDRSRALLAPGLRQIDLLRADLAALRTWTARVRLVREHLLPPATFMAARYGVTHRVALPWFYVRRICRGVPKWFRRLGETR